MEDTTQSQSQANTMVMTPTFAGFSKDVKQPHSSETHRRRENSHKCQFARHLHTLLPTLGQSSGSRRHRLLDSLSGRESSVQEAHRRSTCASCKDTEVSCVLSCYYMTAAISRHSMNPKNQSILHSLTTVDILLINRIDGLEWMSPPECHTTPQVQLPACALLYHWQATPSSTEKGSRRNHKIK